MNTNLSSLVFLISYLPVFAGALGASDLVALGSALGAAALVALGSALGAAVLVALGSALGAAALVALGSALGAAVLVALGSAFTAGVGSVSLRYFACPSSSISAFAEIRMYHLCGKHSAVKILGE